MNTKNQEKAHGAIFDLKDKINEVLDDYLVDSAVSDEIGAIVTQWSKEVVGFDNVLSNAVSLLDDKGVSQQEIKDWATLNGYAMIKCTSIADRLKVEKVAREIWDDVIGGVDMYFL